MFCSQACLYVYLNLLDPGGLWVKQVHSQNLKKKSFYPWENGYGHFVVTNIEFCNEYEYEYIGYDNLGSNTNTNILICWFLVEYKYEYRKYSNIW